MGLWNLVCQVTDYKHTHTHHTHHTCIVVATFPRSDNYFVVCCRSTHPSYILVILTTGTMSYGFQIRVAKQRTTHTHTHTNYVLEILYLQCITGKGGKPAWEWGYSPLMVGSADTWPSLLSCSPSKQLCRNSMSLWCCWHSSFRACLREYIYMYICTAYS